MDTTQQQDQKIQYHGVFLPGEDSPVAVFRDDQIDAANTYRKMLHGNNMGTVVPVDFSFKLSKEQMDALAAANAVPATPKSNAFADQLRAQIMTEEIHKAQEDAIRKDVQKQIADNPDLVPKAAPAPAPAPPPVKPTAPIVTK